MDTNQTTNNNADTNSESKPKRKKGVLIFLITLFIAVLLVVGGICVFLFTPLFKSPKQKLIMAATKTFYSEPSKLYGSDGILLLTLVADGSFDYDADFSLDKLNIEDDALGLAESNSYKRAAGFYTGQEGYINIPERQSFISTTVRYNGFRLTELDTYIDDADVYITDSHVMDGNLYFNTENFGDDYKNSMYSEYVYSFPLSGPEIDSQISDISFNIYDTLEDIQKYAGKFAFKKGNGTYSTLKNIYDNSDVTITGNTKDFKIGQKTSKCQEYKVTIPKETLKNFNLTALSELSDSLDEDFEFLVYIDKKMRIVAISHEYTVPTKELFQDYYDNNLSNLYPKADMSNANIPDIGYEVEILFQGETYLLSDIEANITISNADTDDDIIETHTTYSYQPGNKEFQLDFSLNDNEISMFGSLETNLNSFTLDTEDIEICLDTALITGTIDCSASFSMSRPEDSVPTLSGKDYIIMEMYEDDWSDLVNTISDNFFPF